MSVGGVYRHLFGFHVDLQEGRNTGFPFKEWGQWSSFYDISSIEFVSSVETLQSDNASTAIGANFQMVRYVPGG